MKAKALIRGSSILGTGGGGDPYIAEKIIEKKFNLVSFNEFKQNEIVATSFLFGSMKYNENFEMLLEYSFKAFLRKIDVNGIIPVEIGALAVAVISKISKIFSLPIVDSDIVGYRSAPQIFQEIYTIYKIKRTPIFVSFFDGKDIKCKEIRSYKNEEQLEMILSGLCKKYKLLGVSGYARKAYEIKDILPKGSVSFSMRVGRYKNPYKIAKVLNGKVIGTEKIKNVFIDDSDKRFLTGNFSTENFKVYFRNEYMILNSSSGSTICEAPDLICVYDLKEKVGITTNNIKPRIKVAIITAPCIKVWKRYSYLWDKVKSFKIKNLSVIKNEIRFSSAERDEGYSQRSGKETLEDNRHL